MGSVCAYLYTISSLASAGAISFLSTTTKSPRGFTNLTLQQAAAQLCESTNKAIESHGSRLVKLALSSTLSSLWLGGKTLHHHKSVPTPTGVDPVHKERRDIC